MFKFNKGDVVITKHKVKVVIKFGLYSLSHKKVVYWVKNENGEVWLELQEDLKLLKNL